MGINIYKTVVALTLIICMTALLIAGVISETAGIGIISTTAGYILGNGVNALQGKPPAPMFYPKQPREQD